ncbi:kynureninase [Nocardioides gansuensis]|uniref:Kynureninase n=1 Tax=Nocardioides gansuensis TaxID=2138300 RepID=A0A2T8F6S2_9ACTN|nr:kynureninase [Nocardioides gansuensis]PVG81414.1 kynureninase [Nocardioides gansuensis]
MPNEVTRGELTQPSYAAALDARDPLAACRDEFVGAESRLVYFDGNSLGRPLRATAGRLAAFVEEEWGGRLIRGWDERWYDLPLTLGDEVGRVCLGAAPGQTTLGDSTTVLLYKLVRAAVDAAESTSGSRRTEVVLDTDNFPTDRYVVEGIAEERGLTVRWIDVDRTAGVNLDQVREVVGEQTALVLLSHVAYRSGHLADARAVTAAVHDAGALVLWDLCHSVGAVPVELDAWGVDLAVGCTYKYLNGGPGSPAFAYVAQRHQDRLMQPIRGWMGHADPFLMGPAYQPAAGMRRFISGTPAVVGMLAMQDMLALIDRAGMAAVRDKSRRLTSYAVDLADARLADLGVTVASPRDPAQRGGHVTLQHERMREVTAELWRRDVIPDYRDPGGLRIGLSPLSTSFEEVRRGLEAVREVLLSPR